MAITEMQYEKKSLYLPMKARIKKAVQMTELEKFFEIELEDREQFNYDPGQFVMVSVFGYGEAPISISSNPTKKDGFELCVRKVGKVTEALHRLKEGDPVGIRGPYGKGFNVKELRGKDLLFIGGGIGLVPLRSLIKYSIENKKDFGRIIILYGAKSPKELLFTDELKEWEAESGVNLKVTVDRGDESWKGNVGVITTLIPPLDLDIENTMALIVGPPVMYKFVLLSLFAKKFPEENIILSLERKMKCGVGKCGHCQMNHIYVCQDGPVFYYKDIKDLPEFLH